MSRSGVAPSLYAAKQVKHLLNEVYQIWKRIEELATQGNYDAVILDLQTAFTALETAVSDLDTQVATYTGDINTLQSQMATTITQLNDITATISAVATQTASNTSSINTLNTFRTTTNSRLNALESDVNNLQSDVNNLENDLAAAIHATPKQFDTEVGRNGLTGTFLTNGSIVLIPIANLPADMPTDLSSLLIIGTFVFLSPIANSQIQIGDMFQIHHYNYNGSTSDTWYGFQIVKTIADSANLKLILGDELTIVDRTVGTTAQKTQMINVNWNQGYLILSFVYWPL